MTAYAPGADLTAGTAYRADVDGLRAIAVVSVVLYHLSGAWLPGGFSGVDIFFVISGFVVASSLSQAPSDRFRAFVTFFYARRLMRIVPALVAALLATALAATLLIPRAWLSEFNERTALAAFLGFSNWVLQTNADTYFAPRAEFNPYTHTWSLGIEEQFYLAFPFLFYGWARLVRRGSGRSIAAAALALLGLASLATCAYAMKAAPTAAFYSIACRFWELAAGVLLYQLTVMRTQPAPSSGLGEAVGTLLPWLGLALVALTLALADATSFPWFWAIPPVAGTVLMIGGVHANTAHALRRALANRTMVWIGKRSYSLYLWHWPVFVLLRWTTGIETPFVRAAALLAVVVIAAASYRWIELPLRHHPGMLKRPAILRIIVMLAVVAFGWGTTRVLFSQQDRLSQSTVVRHASDWYVNLWMPAGLLDAKAFPRRCEAAVRHRALAGGQVIELVAAKCAAGVEASAKRLYVIGDSHATAYFPLLEQLSAETGTQVQVYTFPGCAFLDLRLPMTAARGPDCRAFAKAATADVIAQGKSGDVVLLASLRQPRFSDQWTAFGADAVLASTRSEQAKQWLIEARAEAPALMQPLLAAGLRVAFDAPKPVFRSPTFRCADAFTRLNPVCAGGTTVSREEMLALRAPIVDNLQSIASAAPAVLLWDPFPILCPDATCSALRERRPLFFDGDHLSAYGNAVLYPAFRDWFMTVTTR